MILLDAFSPRSSGHREEKTDDAKWIPLATIPFENRYATPIIYGSDNGIVLSPYGECRAIKIYNHKQNIWNDLLRFKATQNISIHTLAVKPKTKSLYLYDGKQYKLDIVNKTFTQIATEIENVNVITNAKNIESCFTNDQYHIIGYGKNAMQHFSWNESKNAFNQHSFYDNTLKIDGYALCCFRKVKNILLLGGFDMANECYLRSILLYKETDTGFQQAEYSMPKAMAYFGCIVTDNDQHIVIFGGETKHGTFLDSIGIMNMNNFKWTRSEVKCPRVGKYTAIKAGEYVHLFDHYGQHSKMLISSIITRIRKQTVASSASKWFQLPKTPCNQFCKPVATVYGNIILSPFNKSNIFVFDADDSKWTSLISLPQTVQFNQHTICLDSKYNKLYLYDGEFDCHFLEMDINTKSIIHIYHNNVADNIEINIPKTGKNPVSVVLNNKLHIMGGFNTKCKHLTWNSQSAGFEEHKMQHGPQESIQGQGIIALQTMRKIILFGGNESTYFGGYIDKIWICDQYFVWRKSIYKMPVAVYGFGYIVTKDEKYIIIFGGKTQKGLIDNIYTWDISTYKWNKCAVKCPKKAKYYAVFNSVIDNVHLFEIGTTNHWTMSLVNIIPSYSIKKQLQMKRRRKITFHNGKEPNYSLIKTLQMELQTAKAKILALQQNEYKLIEENKRLRAENKQLKQQENINNYSNDEENELDNTLSTIVPDTVSDTVSNVVSETINNRPRLRSDTFLLLTDEDFESDVNEQEYEEYETEEEQYMNENQLN